LRTIENIKLKKYMNINDVKNIANSLFNQSKKIQVLLFFTHSIMDEEGPVVAALAQLNASMNDLTMVTKAQARTTLPSDAQQNVYAVTWNAKIVGSPNQLQNQGEGVATAADTKCLLPDGMSAEEAVRVFKNGKCNLLGVSVVRAKSTFPFEINMHLDKTNIKPDQTTGYSTKSHFYLDARDSLKVPHHILNKDTSGAEELHRKFPGHSFQSIRSGHGVQFDPKNPEIKNLKTGSPAAFLIKQRLEAEAISAQLNAERLNTDEAIKIAEDKTATHAAFEYNDVAKSWHKNLPAQVVDGAMAAAAEQFQQHIHEADLFQLAHARLTRGDGLDFNDSHGMEICHADNIAALLNANSSVSRQTMATNAAAPDPVAALRNATEDNTTKLLNAMKDTQYKYTASIRFIIAPLPEAEN
jgi:hypothetical protein